MPPPVVIWAQGMLLDMPNCAQYPAACRNYEQNPASGVPWAVLAAVVILAAVLLVAVVLTIAMVRRDRRRRLPPPPPPSLPSRS